MRATSRSCKAAAMIARGSCRRHSPPAQTKMGLHGPTSTRALHAAAPAWPPLGAQKNEKPLGGAFHQRALGGPSGAAGGVEASPTPPTEGAHSTAGAPGA